MGLFETEGLILKNYNLAEADKIVIFFTQDHGLVRGVAKGAKRLKSRFGGGLEPFSIVRVAYFQKEQKELVSLNHIELVQSFFEEASNPEFLQKFTYLAELLLEFAPPHDPNATLYRMAKTSLETARSYPEKLDAISLYFEFWLLKLGGYLPNWRKCESCRREFTETEKSWLLTNFHLICRQCKKGSCDWLVSPEQRQMFFQAQKLSPAKFVEYTNKKAEDIAELSHVLRKIISHILGKELNTTKILAANI